MTAWINVKMAVVPPIPSASVNTAVAEKTRATQKPPVQGGQTTEPPRRTGGD